MGGRRSALPHPPRAPPPHRPPTAPPTGPRTPPPTLANPHMTGDDIKAAQKLLLKNKYGSWDPGGTDGQFGDLTASAVRRAKWELGYPQGAVNGTFGPQLGAILSGKRPLPAAFKKRRAQRLKQAGPDQTV